MKTIVLLCALLAGCSEPLTSEEVIKQEKICTDAGLSAHEFSNELNMGRITFVQCGRKQNDSANE